MKKTYPTSGKYILDENGNPKEVFDLYEWAEWFEEHGSERRIANTEVGKTRVSTIFLGLDHSFGRNGKPILFETMTFPDQDVQVRYCTKAEALEGHAQIVKQIEDELQKAS